MDDEREQRQMLMGMMGMEDTREGPRVLRLAASDRTDLWGQEELPTATTEWGNRSVGTTPRSGTMQEAEAVDGVRWNQGVDMLKREVHGLPGARVFFLSAPQIVEAEDDGDEDEKEDDEEEEEEEEEEDDDGEGDEDGMKGKRRRVQS